MTLSSSSVVWFLLCTVHDTRDIVLLHLFSNAFMRFVMFLFRVHVSHPYACSYYC